jgi:superfamily II DNA/RNA helicase
VPCPGYTLSKLLDIIYDLTFLKALNLSSLDSLVIDEADLILSYGHDQDMRSVLSNETAYLPTVFQSFLMSATMTKDVEALKGLVLHNPAILRLEEDEDEARNLVQYAVRYDVSKPPPHLMAACSINQPSPGHLAVRYDISLCTCPHRKA